MEAYPQNGVHVVTLLRSCHSQSFLPTAIVLKVMVCIRAVKLLWLIGLVLVIAWAAVKFGINITSVVLEIYHFQYNKSGIYPKFHYYPCYSQLIPYYVRNLSLCTEHASTLIGIVNINSSQ